MKRNLLTAVAMLVSAFFVGTTIAEAADFKFGGQLRPRFEVNEQAATNDNTTPDYFVQQRSRLHTNIGINSDTSAFIQLQSTKRWGNGNGGTTAVDGSTDVGLHQAYFTLKNFAGLPADAKIGRQEFALGGHRIVGTTGWAAGATSHDAVKLTHSAGNHTLGFFYSMLEEVTGSPGANAASDASAYILWGNFKGVLGGALELYWVYLDDYGYATALSNQIHTLGFRQAGKLMGLDYRAEYYYQAGNASGLYTDAGLSREATDAETGGDAGFVSPSASGSMEAWMWGVRVGKKFSNVMWKPKVTFWYDSLSGNDGEDVDKGHWGAFNTVFDTGHKFYGLMDLVSPGGGAATDSTGTMGLQDYAVKLAFSPMPKWTAKIDYHHFATQESPNGNPRLALLQGATLAGSGFGNGERNLTTDLGDEIDITLVHKYNPHTKVVIGYSQFWGSNTFYALEGAAGAKVGAQDQPQWAYVMFDVKF